MRKNRRIMRKIDIIALPLFLLFIIELKVTQNFHPYVSPAFRPSEAKTNLGSIFTSQVTYYGEEDTYASSIENLGWAPEGKTYYSYSVIEGNATQFIARAEGNIDKDRTLDVWEIDHTRTLTNVFNDVIQ
jgi:hypothetical protein